MSMFRKGTRAPFAGTRSFLRNLGTEDDLLKCFTVLAQFSLPFLSKLMLNKRDGVCLIHEFGGGDGSVWA